MSKGNPIIPLRIDQATLDQVDAQVELQNATRADEPYSRSSWIRQAINERLAKLERGRKRKGGERDTTA